MNRNRLLKAISIVATMLAPGHSVSAETAKGYWIVNNDVTVAKAHKEYVIANKKFMQDCGGRYLVLGGRQEVVEGKSLARQIVIEFKDYATALACYRSEEYSRVKLLRAGASDGNTVIVEGFAPTP